MDSTNDEVSKAEKRVWQIEAAITEDIHFDAVKDGDYWLCPCDRIGLPEPRDWSQSPLGLARTAVIGNCHVFLA